MQGFSRRLGLHYFVIELFEACRKVRQFPIQIGYMGHDSGDEFSGEFSCVP